LNNKVAGTESQTFEQPFEKAVEKRVIVYIDGFNFYFGIKEANWLDCLWLNPHALATNLLKPGQQVAQVKYFTSRISDTPGDSGKRKRQSTFLEAIETAPLTTVFYGQFQARKLTCRSCQNKWQTFDEKMTDVNIATQLLCDAFENQFDTAIIISGDSDLTPPIQAIRARFPAKRLIVVFPPERHSRRLQAAANASFQLGRKLLKDSQFPDDYVKTDGYVLRRPPTWKTE
jgi:NYN domain